MIAGRLRSVERPLALAPVEAADVAACERHPHHALAVDIAAARAEAGHRYVVDFRERGLGRVGAGREPYDRAGAGAQRPPDRAVGRARHDSVEHLGDALVLGRIQRLVGLDIFVALAVAVGVEDERRPALRLRRVAGFVEHLGVDPADHAAAAAAGRSTTCCWRRKRTADDGSGSRCRRRCTSASWDRGSPPRGASAPAGTAWPTDGRSPSCRSPGSSGRALPPPATPGPSRRTSTLWLLTLVS